jgi:hypothetical protein
LKGVTADDKRDAAAAGWQLSSRSSRRAGTKRRRVIKSGADDMLEFEGAEEDESEDGDLFGKDHRSLRPSPYCELGRGDGKRWDFPLKSIARQWASTAQKAPITRLSAFLSFHPVARLLRPAH